MAVQLEGAAPNTRGIGARIKLFDGAVPMQSQEIICGGRYLSSDDAFRVFAAGSETNRLSIEVVWRSGKTSLLANLPVNRVYEIDEASAKAATPSPDEAITPLFEGVSQLLLHNHHDEPFDDFQRQPLLSKKLSQLGPGLAWGDWMVMAGTTWWLAAARVAGWLRFATTLVAASPSSPGRS